jgi:FixJ family two-component response regulator
LVVIFLACGQSIHLITGDGSNTTMTYRIAVVDDDASVRKALKRVLEASSYELRVFESACEFIESLPHGIPECLIIDLQMPNMTGLELQHHLNHSGVRIPTIVMTAFDEPGSKEKCIAAGAFAYLLKPLRKATLVDAIDKTIAISRNRVCRDH